MTNTETTAYRFIQPGDFMVLSSRYQTLRINSSLSDFLPVTTGVPQGSLLGPLLFSVYVNDLSQSLNKCEVDSYVDDTKM